MNENLDTGSVLPEHLHKEVTARLHPEDAQVAAALRDQFGRMKPDAAPTNGEQGAVERYNEIATLVKVARGKQMPQPTDRPIAAKGSHGEGFKFTDFTPRFEQAVFACLMSYPDKFDFTLVAARCFNGSALHAIAWEFFKAVQEIGQNPTWIALEQSVHDYVHKRFPEKLDEYLAVLQDVREINAEKELPHVLPRVTAWAKEQLIRRQLEALALNVDGTEEEREEAWKALQDAWGYGQTCRLEDGYDLLRTAIEQPPEIIEGVLHQGHKLMLGGSSKSFKTFTLLDMAVSVSSGTHWWTFPTKPGRVLYVNYEIDRAFFQKRLAATVKAKEVTLDAGTFTHAYMRGDTREPEKVLAGLKQKMRDQGYSLVIFDPIYKMLNGRNENAAGDIAALLNLFSKFAEETGAAVVYGNHFSKGNQAGRESIDRVSGSGVFARDPDAIVTLTKHVNEGTFVAEFTLRNLPPIVPFCVRWEHPLMVLDAEADPAKLRGPRGRPLQYDQNALLGLLSDGPLSGKEWLSRASDTTGISKTTFYQKISELQKTGKIAESKGRYSLHTDEN